MNHDKKLREFLEKYININNNRLDKAKKKVNPIDWTLIKFINNKLWDKLLSTSYQWSFWYHTIIKPNKDDDTWDYDVDLAIKLKYDSDYESTEYKYHDLLIDIFKSSDRYADKLDESKERAIRIQYDSDDWEFHVDLVPMFYNEDNWNVIDRVNNNIEISWWNEFRDWINEQNNKTSINNSKSKYLKEAIRIFKYLRNSINSDIIRSVQFTLLLWRQIDKLEENDFIDLWTTLYWISIKLKEELEDINYISELDLENPWLLWEYFDRNFSDENFQEFKDWFIELADNIIDAYDEIEEDESIEKWKDIFWENFIIKSSTNSIVLYDYNHAKQPLEYWYNLWCNLKKINIIAKKISKHNNKETFFSSSVRIPNNMKLEFYALINENLWTNKLIWQITNESNRFVKNKRWEINNANTDLWYNSKLKWYGVGEEWSRSWRHWIKCFLITENNHIIWESDKFIVNIA